MNLERDGPFGKDWDWDVQTDFSEESLEGADRYVE